MQDSDVPPEKLHREVGDLFTPIFPHGAPTVLSNTMEHSHFPYPPPTATMVPGTPTTINCAPDIDCTLDKLATRAILWLIVMWELLWVINTLHDQCYHHYLLLPPVSYYYLPTKKNQIRLIVLSLGGVLDARKTHTVLGSDN